MDYFDFSWNDIWVQVVVSSIVILLFGISKYVFNWTKEGISKKHLGFKLRNELIRSKLRESELYREKIKLKIVFDFLTAIFMLAYIAATDLTPILSAVMIALSLYNLFVIGRYYSLWTAAMTYLIKKEKDNSIVGFDD